MTSDHVLDSELNKYYYFAIKHDSTPNSTRWLIRGYLCHIKILSCGGRERGKRIWWEKEEAHVVFLGLLLTIFLQRDTTTKEDEDVCDTTEDEGGGREEAPHKLN